MLNGRAGFEQRAKDDDGVATVFSVVYVTMSASFTGPTAGFVTQTGNNQPSKTVESSSAAKATQTSSNSNSNNNSNNNKDNDDNQSQTTSHSSAKVTSATSTESSLPKQTAIVGTPVRATQSGTVSASASATPTQDSSNQGMSGGAKAGVAFGVILGIALVAGIVFFVVRRKKQQKQEQESHDLDNEKNGFGFAPINNTPRNDNASNINANSRAPRLSLRPVTQFLPGIGEPKVQEMTSATGGLNSFLAPAPPTQQHKSSWERRASNNPDDAANPFGSNAERIDNHAADRAAENAPIPVPVTAAPVPAPNPFADKPASSRSISPVEESPLASTANSPPKAEIATAAAVAVGAAPGSTSPKGGAASNVHRVQLDFKPSMEDELELRAGDVVRLLHEYDDGWALCSYMDRSKQGVTPRTCLSKLPLKPRPVGPPPGMRPLGRPESPAHRNFSGPPSTGPRNMYPAPLSPSMPNMNMPRGPNSPPNANRMRSRSQSQSVDNGNRASPQMMQSVGFGASPPRDHRRSASMGQLAMGTSPTRVARKPVPGQAM
ncbi:Ephexin-1 [Elsinoe australis]|uniref:Ephexin-1 n=1 Tax=Elsinoe australis TaxID=40998 RepID=A0A2P7ZDF8_9PEZI|nr:Ephexin-1 [Elsinoe australis]